MTNNDNRIDPTPVRLSTNVSIDRQTPKTDFGDRLKSGLDAAAGTLASGAAVVAPFVPGGAIVSAAVSSVTQMSTGSSSGAQTAAGTTYGVQSLGGGGSGINTTVSGGNTGSVSSLGGMPTSSGPFVPGGGSSSSGGTVGQMNTDLIQAQAENAKLMQVQIAMQRENQVFTTVSNVLKTRHDTVKNTISNVR